MPFSPKDKTLSEHCRSSASPLWNASLFPTGSLRTTQLSALFFARETREESNKVRRRSALRPDKPPDDPLGKERSADLILRLLISGTRVESGGGRSAGGGA